MSPGRVFVKNFIKTKVLEGTLRYCVARSQRPTTTTSILRPIRSQFYVQFDLNVTSNSISILRPIRPQFYVQSTSTLRPIRPQLYVQFDLNFTSNSISILRPIRPQFHVQSDLNFTSNSKPMGHLFLPTVQSRGDMKLPLPTIATETI